MGVLRNHPGEGQQTISVLSLSYTATFENHVWPRVSQFAVAVNGISPLFVKSVHKYENGSVLFKEGPPTMALLFFQSCTLLLLCIFPRKLLLFGRFTFKAGAHSVLPSSTQPQFGARSFLAIQVLPLDNLDLFSGIFLITKKAVSVLILFYDSGFYALSLCSVLFPDFAVLHNMFLRIPAFSHQPKDLCVVLKAENKARPSNDGWLSSWTDDFLRFAEDPELWTNLVPCNCSALATVRCADPEFPSQL